ncbi:unnamed protein product [Auanema sp. JU1783]|nr:unnamed protein product [Auanema sp. JU1783]
MITRLLLCGILMLHYQVDALKDCKTRVDVLNGNDLSEGLAVFLTTKLTTNSPSQCASECFRRRCDVAYFHWDRRECQFTSNSSSSLTLECEDYHASRLIDENPEVDTTQRFCIKCKKLTTNQVFGNSLARSSTVSPPPQAKQLFTIPTRPTRVYVDWHPAKASGFRDRRVVQTIPVPPRPTQRLMLARIAQPVQPILYNTDSSVQVHKSFNRGQSRGYIGRTHSSLGYRRPYGVSHYRIRGSNGKAKVGRFFHHRISQQRTSDPKLKTRGAGIA